MIKEKITVILTGEPDVKGGLDSIQESVRPLLKDLAVFIGWGGSVVCFFVLMGLLVSVGIKRREHRVIDRESILGIGVVLIIMVVLSAVGVWSTFFLR